jgi:hypothetical protein
MISKASSTLQKEEKVQGLHENKVIWRNEEMSVFRIRAHNTQGGRSAKSA